MHRHARGVDRAQVAERRGDRLAVLPADGAGHEHHLGQPEPRLDGLADQRRVAPDDPDAGDLRARVARRGGERVGVHVDDLAGAGRAVDVDELVADGDHRDPRPRVHEDLRAPDRGQQPDLRRPDDDAAAHRDVPGGDVLAGAAHEGGGGDGGLDGDAGAAGGHRVVGVVVRGDGVGEGRQRGAGGHADGLLGAQPVGLPRAGRDLADHRQLHRLRRRPRARRPRAPRTRRRRPGRSRAARGRPRPPRRTAAPAPRRWARARARVAPRRRAPAAAGHPRSSRAHRATTHRAIGAPTRPGTRRRARASPGCRGVPLGSRCSRTRPGGHGPDAPPAVRPRAKAARTPWSIRPM